jgi:hypothetical protein
MWQVPEHLASRPIPDEPEERYESKATVQSHGQHPPKSQQEAIEPEQEGAGVKSGEASTQRPEPQKQPPGQPTDQVETDVTSPSPFPSILPPDIISDITSSAPLLNPPVSSCIQCIMYLTCLFFVVYTALFILQTPGCLGLPPWEREEKSFLAVVETVHFVPMLCVLIMATRIRAVELTKGQPDHYGLPQWWVKVAMQVCTWSVLALALFVLVISQVNSEVLEPVTKQRDKATTMLRLLRNGIILNIYVSFTVICIGAIVMKAPPEIVASGDAPRDNASLTCTLVLAVVFFGMYIVRTSATFANRAGLLGQARRFGNAQELLRNATGTVAFAPMLGVLFITARMRIFQLDQEERAASDMPIFCYMCTASVLIQAGLIAAHYAIARSQDRRAETEKDGTARQSSATKNIERARSVVMACLYLGVVGVMVSLVRLKPPKSTRADMPVTLTCVIILAALYFGTYFTLWVLQLMRGGLAQNRSSIAQNSLEEYLHDWAKVQVAFCPMFSVLFLATMLRALLLTGGLGSPQAWCELFQQIATAAIVLLVLVRFDALLPTAIPRLTLVCAILQYVCLFVLYTSAIVCVVALFTMTSETVEKSPHTFGRWLQVLQLPFRTAFREYVDLLRIAHHEVRSASMHLMRL